MSEVKTPMWVRLISVVVLAGFTAFLLDWLGMV